MKKEEKKKLRELNMKALEERLEKETKEANKLKLKLRTGKLKDTNEYKKKRKELAIMKTLIKEKKLINHTKVGEKE